MGGYAMKTLGLIGGTSWHSTIAYYRYLNSMVEEHTGIPPHNPPLLLYSLNVDLMRRNNWDEIRQSYLDISLRLEAAGAEALMICANTPHKVCPFVAPQLKIPFIHIADAIGQEAQRLGLSQLGLLGTTPTMEEDFISGFLTEHYDIQTLTPADDTRPEVHRIIAEELTRGIFTADTKAFVIREMEKLRTNGAQGIILGCTEFPLLLQQEDFELPLLNTTLLHARKGVEFIVNSPD